MKMNDEHIKQQIKEAFEPYQPVYQETKTRIQVIAAIERQHEPKCVNPILWRWVAPAAFSLLAIGIVVGQMLTPSIINPSSEIPSSEAPVPIQPVLQSSQAVFGFETISATTLLPMINLSDPLGRFDDYGNQEDEVTEDEIAVIDRYLRVSEQIIRGRDNLEFTSETSDLPAYDYKETVTTFTALGQIKTYTYYFNITLIGEDKADSFIGSQGGHSDEITYEINGIVLYGDQTYELIGRKVEEVDDDEVEQTITTTIKIDAQNYVSVRHKTEEDEESYQYEVVENRKSISKVKVKIEREDDEISIQVTSLQPQSNEQIRYEWNEEEPNLIEIDYRNQGNQPIRIRVYLEDVEGVTVYTYEIESSGEKYHRDEDRHGHGNNRH